MAATLRAAISECRTNRRALWVQIVTMLVNDMAFVVFWFLFFDEVGTVGGWSRHDVLTLLAIFAVAAGLVLGFCANLRWLGQQVLEGGLDAVLALPVSPLSVLIFRRLAPLGIGDLLFGVVLFVLTGPDSVESVVLFMVVAFLGAVVFASFLLAAGSLTFWSGSTDAGDLGFNAITMLAAYPVDLFGGLARVFVFTVVPAAFVSTVPARVVVHGDLTELLVLFAFAVGSAAIAVTLFTVGLRRYTGTSVWTRA